MFRIAGIEKNSVVDGDGWRYVIFFQGCKHHCRGCHNPETWNFTDGKEMNIQDIIQDLQECNKDKLMDITFSGGDPFFQAKEIIPLAKELKQQGYNIWAYTGFRFNRFLNYINAEDQNKYNLKITDDMIKLLDYIDVVVDGRFVKDKRTVELSFRGSTNQRLIDVKKSLADNKIVQYEIGE